MAEGMAVDIGAVCDQYAGGQAEIQNQGEGYMFRGEIRDIHVAGDDVTINFNWVAELDGYPRAVKGWKKSEVRPYQISLKAYSVSDIGDNRLCLQSAVMGELTVLFPPDGSKLDPAKVKGLDLKLVRAQNQAGTKQQ